MSLVISHQLIQNNRRNRKIMEVVGIIRLMNMFQLRNINPEVVRVS